MSVRQEEMGWSRSYVHPRKFSSASCPKDICNVSSPSRERNIVLHDALRKLTLLVKLAPHSTRSPVTVAPERENPPLKLPPLKSAWSPMRTAVKSASPLKLAGSKKASASSCALLKLTFCLKLAPLNAAWPPMRTAVKLASSSKLAGLKRHKPLFAHY